MAKMIWATPVYLSVAWTLMISYQLFTEAAVKTVVSGIGFLFPSAGFWLASRVDMIIFVYAFSWVFLLSSAIPSVILGKERGILLQFFVCLILTFTAFIILDTIENMGGPLINQLRGATFLFSNPIFATLYLSLPYILMFTIDWRVKKKQKQDKKLEKLNQDHLENAIANEEESKGGRREGERLIDLYGKQGSYTPAMGPNMKEQACPACGTKVQKLSLGGGQIYYCPTCQI